MAYKFTDPVANASTIGFLLMLIGLMRLLDGNFSPLPLLIMILYFGAGFGLWKKKLWGLYLFGGLAALSVILFLYNLSLGVPLLIFDLLLGPVINIALFVWFWNARARFSK
jgi:hypothetical protein